MEKKGQVGIIVGVVAIILIIIAGIFAVAYVTERSVDLKPGFHPKLRNCQFLRTVNEVDKEVRPRAVDLFSVNEVELACQVVNLGDTMGDVLVEIGILPKKTAREWGWTPPTLSLFDPFTDPAILRQTSCCAGNLNIKAVSITDLKPGEKIDVSVLVEVPHPRFPTSILGLNFFQQSEDACGDNLMWDGTGDKYVAFAHIFDRCWTPDAGSGSRGEVLKNLQILEVK